MLKPSPFRLGFQHLPRGPADGSGFNTSLRVQQMLMHRKSCLIPVLMDKCHNWDIGSMWCKDLPNKIYVGQWPTFHGLVILSFILKTTWWMNVVMGILIHKLWPENTYVGKWPIFHGTGILPYILNTIWWTILILWILVQFDTKISRMKFICHDLVIMHVPISAYRICWSLIWNCLWM